MLTQFTLICVVIATVLPQECLSQQCGCGCQSSHQPQIIRTAPIEIPCQHCLQNQEEFSTGCSCQSCQGQNEPRMMDTSLAGSVSQMLSRILGSLHFSHTQEMETQEEPEEPRRQLYLPQNLAPDSGCQSNSFFFSPQDTSSESSCPFNNQPQVQPQQVLDSGYQSQTQFFSPQDLTADSINTQTQFQQVLDPGYQPQTQFFFPQDLPADSINTQSFNQYHSSQNSPSESINQPPPPPPQLVSFTEPETLTAPKPLYGNPGSSPAFPQGIIGSRFGENLDDDFPAQIILQNQPPDGFPSPPAVTALGPPTQFPSSQSNPSENLEFGVFQRPIPAVHVIPGPDFDEESLYVVKNRSDSPSLVDGSNSLIEPPQMYPVNDKKYFQPGKNNLINKQFSNHPFEMRSKDALSSKPSENDIFSKNRNDKL